MFWENSDDKKAWNLPRKLGQTCAEERSKGLKICVFINSCIQHMLLFQSTLIKALEKGQDNYLSVSACELVDEYSLMSKPRTTPSKVYKLLP